MAHVESTAKVSVASSEVRPALSQLFRPVLLDQDRLDINEPEFYAGLQPGIHSPTPVTNYNNFSGL